jgi:hypothetical protein
VQLFLIALLAIHFIRCKIVITKFCDQYSQALWGIRLSSQSQTEANIILTIR